MASSVKSPGGVDHSGSAKDNYDAWWDEIRLRMDFITKEVVTLKELTTDENQNESGQRSATPIHMDTSSNQNAAQYRCGTPINVPVTSTMSRGVPCIGPQVTNEIRYLCDHLRSGTPIDPQLEEDIDSMSDAYMSDVNMSDVNTSDANTSDANLSDFDMSDTNDEGNQPEPKLKKHMRNDVKNDVDKFKIKKRAHSAPVQRGHVRDTGRLEKPRETYVSPQIVTPAYRVATKKAETASTPAYRVVTRRAETVCVPMSVKSYHVPSQTTVVSHHARSPERRSRHAGHKRRLDEKKSQITSNDNYPAVVIDCER
jgi:hypothetical protein